MDNFQKKHAARSLIGLLILINLVTLATLWFSFLRKPPFEPPSLDEGRGQEVQLFLKRKLNLTEDQARKFEDLRNQFVLSLPAVQDEIQRLKEMMMNELFITEPDERKVEALVGEIAANEAKMEKLLFSHFRDLVAILQPDQRRKFESIMSDLLRMIGPPGSPRPPGGKPPFKGRPDDRPPQKRRR